MNVQNNFIARNAFLSLCYLLFSSSVSAQYDSNPLSQAADNTAFNFISENFSAYSQTRESNFDGDAIQMAKTEHNGVSVFATFVPNETQLRFNWKVSSQSCCDYLAVVIADRNVESIGVSRRISGERNWETISLNIPAGGHWIIWGYTKNSSGSSGQDTGWIDNVRIGNTGRERVNNPIETSELLPPIISFLLEEDPIANLFTADSVSVNEGGVANVTLKLEEEITSPIQITYETQNSTALASRHYNSTYGSLEFNPSGIKTVTIPVAISPDELYSGSKAFYLIFKQYGQEVARSEITITFKPNFIFPENDIEIVEGSNSNISISLTDASNETVEVDYNLVNGNALVGEDYENTSGRLIFQPGETTKLVAIQTLDDQEEENSKFAYLTLSNPSNADLPFTPRKRVYILDNEANYFPDVDIADMTPATPPLPPINQTANYIVKFAGEAGAPLNLDNAEEEFTPANSQMSVSIDETLKTLSFVIDSPPPSSDSSIRLSGGIPIKPGKYTRGASWPFIKTGENGSRIYLKGSYCSEPRTEFRIFDIEIANGEVSKLNADFITFCSRNTVPAKASIRYDSSL